MLDHLHPDARKFFSPIINPTSSQWATYFSVPHRDSPNAKWVCDDPFSFLHVIEQRYKSGHDLNPDPNDQMPIIPDDLIRTHQDAPFLRHVSLLVTKLLSQEDEEGGCSVPKVGKPPRYVVCPDYWCNQSHTYYYPIKKIPSMSNIGSESGLCVCPPMYDENTWKYLENIAMNELPLNLKRISSSKRHATNSNSPEPRNNQAHEYITKTNVR